MMILLKVMVKARGGQRTELTSRQLKTRVAQTPLHQIRENMM